MSSDFVSIEDVYNTNADIKQEDIESLKKWAEKQPHLPKITDLQLALFLSSCHFYIEGTKSCIENYYSLRTLWPDFFANRDPLLSANQRQLKAMLITPLSKLTANNEIVLFFKLLDDNPANFDITVLLRLMDMVITLMGQQKGPNNGFLLVADGRGLGFGQFSKMNPMTLKKWSYFMQEAMPQRMNALHLINVNAFTDKLVQLVKPWLGGDQFNQLNSHRTMESLYKFVDKDMLPSDYGGSEATTQELHAIQNRNIEEHAEFFIEDQKLKADESKRQGKATNHDEHFGVEGSFKQLSID